MRLFRGFAVAAWVIVMNSSPLAAASSIAGRLSIDVRPGDWGNASVQDIAAVLDSVASILAPHFPKRASARVVVQFSKAGPRVLARKSPEGAYLVALNVQDRRWDQFAYQFSHELCHIFSNYDQRPLGEHSASRPHQWFEETLCEVVALVTLKRLASEWKQSPPKAGWGDYAPAFLHYAQRLLSREHRRLPAHETLAAWYATHRVVLEADPYLRHKNEQLAASLLDLFESTPRSLEAIGYLNLEQPSGASFAAYLAAWLECCPPEHRPFVAELIALVAGT